MSALTAPRGKRNGRETMRQGACQVSERTAIMQRARVTAAAVLGIIAAAQAARADDLVRIACGTIGDWDVSVLEFGKRAGIFHTQGIDVEVLYNDGTAPTIQATISGSVDIGFGVGVAGFLAPATKGAPVKIISAQFTGLDNLWYVRADSLIRGFGDLREQNTVSYSTNGSSTNIAALAMLQQVGVKAKVVATGAETGTLTQVMSGQIDVGHNTDGGLSFGDAAGKVRVIGKGSDLVAFRDVTSRVLISTDGNLAKRRDVIIRFMKAYQQTVDWMYEDPAPLQWFADQKHVSVAEAKASRDDYYPKTGMRLGHVHGIETSIKLAVEYKRIEAPITVEQFAKYQDIVFAPPPQ